jgi:hypothetical protein
MHNIKMISPIVFVPTLICFFKGGIALGPWYRNWRSPILVGGVAPGGNFGQPILPAGAYSINQAYQMNQMGMMNNFNVGFNNPAMMTQLPVYNNNLSNSVNPVYPTQTTPVPPTTLPVSEKKIVKEDQTKK